MSIDLHKLPAWPQSQDSVSEQLASLIQVANRLGFYDAADAVKQMANNLEDLADALEAPTLLERAMKGDAAAAKQFLHEAGFTDKQGQWLPQYQPIPEAQ